MSSEKNYDDLLYPILCNEGNIYGFFDRIFDFLYRRTDYFKVKFSNSSNLGFEPGEAERILRCTFIKYMEQAIAEQNDEVENLNDSVPIDYVTEEVVTTCEPESDSLSLPKETESSSSSVPKETENSATEVSKSDDQSMTEDAKTPWMDPDCYNGAQYDDYSWAQTLRDIDVRVKVPVCIKTGKQVQVDIHQGHLKLSTLVDDNWEVLKEGDLTWKINVEESTWTLVPYEHVHICLQKIQERWWDSLFVGEPKLDMKAIDPSIPFEELDRESQAKIEELMYNEHMKRLGKPTIQQNKVQRILKDAWNAEGSPFKGQPYDPTLVNIQNSDTIT